MLSTSRPARSPLTHLERVKFTPLHDPHPSTRLRSPVNVNLSSDGDSLVLPTYTPTSASPRRPYDFHQPTRSGPPRIVTNFPKLPSAELRGQTLGGRTVDFDRTRRRNPSVTKRVRFQGVEIIPPLPDSPLSPTLPTENVLEDVHKPSGFLGVDVKVNIPTILVFSDENTSLTPYVHTHVYPDPDHGETTAMDEFPDSPSVYSPTPPNSSVPPTFDLSERGPPQLAGVDWVASTATGNHHTSVRCLTGDGPPSELPTSDQPRSKDGLFSISKDIPYAAVDGRAAVIRHNDSTEALSWWGRVSTTVATLSTANIWKKGAQTIVDKPASVK